MKKTLFTLTIALLMAQSVSAEEISTDFVGGPANPNAVKPSIFLYEAKPGDVIHDELLVKNTSDKELTLRVYGVDSLKTAEGGTGFKARASEMLEIGAWLQLTETEFVFAPQETKKIPFTVTVPADAEKRDYIGGIALEKFIPSNGGSVNTALRLIKNVNLKVTDTPEEIPAMMASTFEVKPFFWVTAAIAGGCFAWLLYASRKKKHAEKN